MSSPLTDPVNAQTVWGAIITAFGVIVGSVILIIVKRTKPAVGTVDMWKQINSQNATITSQNSDISGLQTAVAKLQQQRLDDRETQLNVNRVMGDGFDALSGYVRRTTAAGRKPEFSDDEREKIERARALRDSDDLWPTASKGSSPS